MGRILTTLDAILHVRPEDVFPEPAAGLPTTETIHGSLLAMRSDRLELRRLAEPAQTFARLPLDRAPSGVSLAQLHGKDVLIPYTRESVIVWDPNLSTPVAEFKVDTAYGIYSVGHWSEDGALYSIVSTIDGVMYRLRDMVEVDSWQIRPDRTLGDIVVLPNHRTLGLADDARDLIVELDGKKYRPCLTKEQLREQLARLPLFGEYFKAGLAEKQDWHRKFTETDPSSVTISLGSPRRRKAVVDGRTLLTLDVQLEFLGRPDSVLVLLEPDHDPQQVVGYFHVRDRSVLDFDLRSLAPGNLSLVCGLLSDHTKLRSSCRGAGGEDHPGDRLYPGDGHPSHGGRCDLDRLCPRKYLFCSGYRRPVLSDLAG